MFYISPGVYIRESDISDRVGAIAATSAAVVGSSLRGRIDTRILCTSGANFVSEFGNPKAGNYFHYSALAYLEKGNQLYCLRVVHTDILFGGVNILSSPGTANVTFATGQAPVFPTTGLPTMPALYSVTNLCFNIFAKDPGTWNNKVSVEVLDADPTATNVDGTAIGNADKEFVIKVYEDDPITALPILQESFVCSRQTKLDGYGRQLFLENRINGFSRYIWVRNSALADTTMPLCSKAAADGSGVLRGLYMTKGTDGSAVTDAMYNGTTTNLRGWYAFVSPEHVDFRIMINAGLTAKTTQQTMQAICESRKDCIAVLDMMPADAALGASSQKTWRTTQAIYSSYTALYSPWLKVYDSISDQIIEVPPSGYVAGVMALTDNVGAPWVAPAGFNRGSLNVLGTTNVFDLGSRDVLYSVGINPIQAFMGQGIVVYGQKTQAAKASALDRINVRRSLIVVEKSCAAALQFFTFENNTSATRFRLFATIDEFMNRLSGAGAFQAEANDKGYLVVCDERNNTPAVIDANQMNVDIFVKPARTAEFIQLQIIITQTSASFTELIARGVLF